MKNIIKKQLLLLGSLFALSSCNLDTIPQGSVDSEMVFATTETTDQVLSGSWAYMMETYGTYANPGHAALLRLSDAMGSDAVLRLGKYGFLGSYQYVALNSLIATIVSHNYNIPYKVINNCNNIIAKVDAAQGPDTDKARIKGQAYALRGYLYTTLASVYALSPSLDPNAKCVPIYTEPTTPTTEGQPRKSVSQVYAQAISDLKAAEGLIPESYERGDAKHKIDQQVLFGLLARAYLYTQDWANAAVYAAKAHQNGPLMNESDYVSGFNNVANSEWIWGHKQTLEQSNASYNFHYQDITSSGSYYKSFGADPFFIDLFDDSDYRKKLFVIGFDPVVKDGRIVNYLAQMVGYKKFRFKDNITADIVLMRASEMYLIEAEANAHISGKLVDGINTLNILKTARGAQLLATTVTQEQAIAAILIERRKELFGEGFALVDIIRTQGTVVRKEYTGGVYLFGTEIPLVRVKENAEPILDSDGKTTSAQFGHHVRQFPDKTPFVANSPKYTLPIPQSEYNNNPNLDK